MRTQRCIFLLSDCLQIIIGLCMHVCKVPWPIALRFVVPFSSVTFCVLFNFKTKCLKNYGSFLVCVQNVKEKFVTFIFHFFKTSQQISPNKCFFFYYYSSSVAAAWHGLENMTLVGILLFMLFKIILKQSRNEGVQLP